MGRCASIIELGSSTPLEHLVKTRRCGFTAFREANVAFGDLICRTWEVHSRPETSKPSLVHSQPFDGSQDWVIAHNDVVAGSSPASGTKCRSSSVVEHVNSQFVSYPSVLSAGRRFWVIGHCGLAVQVRLRVSTRVAQFAEPQCYPDRALTARILMGRRHWVIGYWFESNPGLHTPW